MKWTSGIGVVLVLLISCGTLRAQEPEKPLYLKNEIRFLAKNLPVDKKTVSESCLCKNSLFGVLQFSQLPTDAQKASLLAKGVYLMNYLPQDAFLVQISLPAPSESILSENGVRSFYAFTAEDKIGERCRDEQPADEYYVWFYTSVSKQDVEKALEDIAVNLTFHKHQSYFSIPKNPELLEQLAAMPFVYFIENHNSETVHDGLENPKTNRANTINTSGFSGAKNLTGQGLTALTVDGGNIDPHPDLHNRINNFHSSNWSSYGEHAELVTGIAGGAGNLNPYNRGLAFKANFHTMKSGYLLNNAYNFYSTHNVRFTNNSYGSTYPVYGYYLSKSRELDLICNAKADYLHFTSASNHGQITYGSYPKGFHTVNDNFKSSKNSLVVGNIDITDSIMPSSSKGPVKDGRIKPEFCANGSSINAVSRGNDYVFKADGGTSSATPSAMGAAMLLTQRYHKIYAKYPHSAYIKNLMANTADDIGNTGPDFTYGYGRINARRALAVLEAFNTRFDSVSNNTTKTTTVYVPSGKAQLNVMLSWNDPAATANTSRTLVNDLDLEIVAPNNTVYYPWRLDYSAANVENNATTGRDSINNLEQVTINSPAIGWWTVRVKGHSIPSGKQPYHVTWEKLDPDITVTYPYAGEKLAPGQDIYIRWDAYDGSSNTFNIEYTSDNGQNWTTIDNSVASNLRHKVWTLPQTNSGEYKVRVSRNSTSSTSTSAQTFTVASRPVPTTATICHSYARLAWNPVSNAQSYTVWYLDTIMKPLRTVTGTADTVFMHQNHDNNWFAVSTNFNGYSSERSTAVRPATSSNLTCPFPYDLAILDIVGLDDGRKNHASELTTTETISVRCVNRGTASLSNFTFSYRVGNGSVVNQQYSNTLNAGDTLVFSFSTKANLASVGTHLLDVWVNHASDNQALNDSLLDVQVKQLDNPTVSLPYLKDFSGLLYPASVVETTQGINNYAQLDFETTVGGKLRKSSSGKGFYLQSQSTSIEATNYLTFNLNLAAHSGKNLGMTFNWTQFAEDEHVNDKLWIRGADTMPWIEVLNLYETFGNYQKKDILQQSPTIRLTDELSKNGQVLTPSAQIRFGQQDNGVSVKTQFPYIGTGGVLLDELAIFEMGPDIAALEVLTPTIKNCGYHSFSDFEFSFRNGHNQSVTGVKTKFQLDQGSVQTKTLGAFAANSASQNSFKPTGLTKGWHTVKFWVEYANDSFPENDTVKLTFFNSKTVSFFPHVEDFETDNGNWWTDGKNSSWEWGTPSSTDITGAGSGNKCWATDLTGIHNAYEISYLNFPCFATNSFGGNDAVWEALVFGDSRRMWIEYSNDNGDNWIKLGQHGDGVNWYNSQDHFWTSAFNGWHRVKYEIPNNIFTASNLITFRCVFEANDNFNWQEGFAIDSFGLKVLDQDLELLSLNAPGNECGLGQTEQVSIAVANLSHKASSWVQVRYRINGGAIIKDSIANISGDDTVTHNLRATHDFSQPIKHSIDIWLESELDRTRTNDSIIDYQFTSKPLVSSFPYTQSFETNIGGWHAEGQSSTWEQGTVSANQHPNSASHGSKCWATGLSGNHSSGENSYWVSPCFDMRSYTSSAYLEFHTKYALRPNGKFYVEYTEDGTNWTKLGSNGSGLNWYNNAGHYFSGTQTNWTKTRWPFDLSSITDSSSIQFRFVLENDVNDLSATEGIAIDNVRVYEILNDLELVSILTPGTGCGLGSSETIQVQLRNNSAIAQSNATLKYSINGGAVQSMNVSSISANSTSNITLSSNTDFSQSGEYELKTWVDHTGDTYADNDSSTFNFVRSASVSSFPYAETFEANNGGWFSTGNSSTWAWGTPSGAPITTASQGQKAWTTNLSGSHNANEVSYLHSPCFDVSGFNGEAHVDFDFYKYLATDGKVWVEYSDDDGNTWTRLGQKGDGGNWYNNANHHWSGQGTGWKHARIRLPSSSISNQQKIRFRLILETGNQTAAGFAFDHFTLRDVVDDAAIVAISNPDINEGTGTKTVTVQVANYMENALTNVPIKYQFNNSAVVSETISQIAADDTATYSFTQSLSLASAGNLTLKVWADMANDNAQENDSSTLNMTVETAIASFPYFEGFEGGNGNWTTTGSPSSWEHGTPNDALTQQAAHGHKCFATNLDGNVIQNEVSYLSSPLFDFRGLSQNPIFSFYNIFQMDWQSKYYLEYSEDDNTWVKIGLFNNGTNWYNNGGHYWSQSQTEWKEAIYEIPLNNMTDSSKVRFRFVLDVGSQHAYPGLALDDIFIGTKGTDLQVLKVTAPDTSCALGNSETVTVNVKNLASIASGVYNLSYSLNGGSAVTQQFSSLSAGSSANVSFTTKANLSSVQKHNFRVWSASSTDHYHLNDTLEHATYKQPSVSQFPYSQTFENGLNGWVTGGTLSSWEVGTPASSSFTSAANGQKCVATNLDGNCNTDENSHLMSPCFDFRGMSSAPTILFNLAYKLGWTNPGLHLEYSENGSTWIKLGSSGSGQNWYNNNWDNVWDQGSTSWKVASFSIPLNSIQDSSAVKFRFVLKGSQWSSEEGVVIDDIRIQNITDDLEMVSIDGPISGVGLGQETVSIKVKNNGSQNLTNVFVYYRLDGGSAVKDTIPSILSGATASFNFTQKANATATNSYVVDAWVAHSSDNLPLNDTLKGHTFTHTSYINSYPYFADFESGSATFYSSGTLNSWQHGTPSPQNTQLKRAASGSKVWGTALSGDFNLGEQSYLYSPYFDLSGFSSNPIISLSMLYNVGFAVTVTIEYSEDGTTWTSLNSHTDGVNWNNWGWSGQILHWHTASTEIPVGSMTDDDSVQFRVKFYDGGWGFETEEGLLIDNFHIHEKAKMHSGKSARGLTKTVSGNSWIHFEKNGNRVLSINPQGQNLGSTTVDCYVDEGNTRSHADQYLLDRSWVVDPTTQPSSEVKVRVYFLESEMDSIRLATNCQTCTAVEDAYKLGFTKYHGNNEDSLLTNNTSGSYQFFGTANVTMMPYGKGYCAEFSVNSFSEIFGNSGGDNGNAPLPVELVDFRGEMLHNTVELTWLTAQEINNDFFEIQRSVDGTEFETVGSVKGKGNTLEASHYQFIDKNLPASMNNKRVFYRLRQSDFGGSFAHSNTISLQVENQELETLKAWPTQFTHGFQIENSGAESVHWQLTDATGKMVKQGFLAKGINQVETTELPAGLYQLVCGENTPTTIKLVKIL